MLETYRGVVYPKHIDLMGHMNVQHYTARFDEATWHLFAHIGITNSYMKRSGCGMAAVHQEIDFRAEAIAGDLIVIRSTIREVRDKSIIFHHRMYRSDTEQLLAVSRFVGVHFDRGTRKACPFPENLIGANDTILKESCESANADR